MKDHRYIAELIKNSEVPLSLTRIGDGEARLLNWRKDKPAANFSLNKHMGRVPSDAEILEIRDNLIYAYNKSSIIGIPTRKHFKRNDKYWSSAENLMYELAPESKNVMKCSIDIHTEWILNDTYRELLQDKENVYIITCRDVAEGLKRRYNIKNVYQFLISEQWQYDVNRKENHHYPDQFQEIKAWIGGLSLNLDICLCGAGFVGKIYNVWFQQRGGISIDIGHVFDKWAGMATRGVGGKVGITSDKYKL